MARCSRIIIPRCGLRYSKIIAKIPEDVREYVSTSVPGVDIRFDGVITGDVARTALDLMDVDKMGLDHVDRNILVTMIELYKGGPVGLETLAATIGEDPGTIEEVYEPYLIMNGFITRTPRGRMVTELATKHLGIEI